MRAIFGMIAVVFLLGTLILLHVVAYIALRPSLSPLLDGIALLAADLVLTILFALLASRNTPDQIEIEAKLLREQALSEMKESLAIMALVGPLARIATRTLGAKGLYGMTLAALTAKFFSNARN